MTVFSPSVPLEALSHPSFGKVELFELPNCSGPVEVHLHGYMGSVEVHLVFTL